MNNKFYTILPLCVLLLVSFNGYSKVVTSASLPTSLPSVEKKTTITVSSNRATGDMLLYIVAEKAGEATISLVNESGSTVLQQTNKVTKSKNVISLKDIQALAEGTYTVRMVLHNQTFSTTFMIWK